MQHFNTGGARREKKEADLWLLARALEVVIMVLETIKCEDCGTIILIWSGQDRLCHNCKQKRLRTASQSVEGNHRGLGKWI